MPACGTCGAPKTTESSVGGMCAACLLAVALAEPSARRTTERDGIDTLPAGTALGPFVIARPLGRGGMGAVYEAQDTRLDRTVALKVLPAEFLYDKTFARRFENEARVIASLEHPNIVPIYAAGIDSGVPWMSMRLLTGDSLSVLLERRRVQPSEAVPLLRQVAAALDYAHGRGVVHRDIKPANILLDSAGTACVADFGLARMSGAGNALTQTGMIIGTPHYMAPEQALGRPADHRCDIYSLGIVAYEMLVGTTPFTGSSAVAVLLQHVHEALPPAAGSPSSSGWMDAIRKATAKDPADRWPSAGAFVDALAVNIESGALPAGVTAASFQRAAPSSRSVWAAVAGGALVATAGLIWAVVHQPRTVPPTTLAPVTSAPQPQSGVPPNATLPSNDRATAPKANGNLSNREPRPGPAAPRPSGATVAAPPPPQPSIGPSAEAPADASATTATAHVETPLLVEPLSRAPGVTVPPPQPSDLVTEPEVIHKVRPAYPPAAIAAGLQGNVIVEGLVGEDGKVRDITVLRPVHPLLDMAARKALAEYQFKPARRNGIPIPWPYRLEVPFTLK